MVLGFRAYMEKTSSKNKDNFTKVFVYVYQLIKVKFSKNVWITNYYKYSE